MTFGSLFSGIGGFDLGFERAGLECLWQVENDGYCTRQLERHWPEVERLGDVRGVGGHNLKPVDVICGGFPCTDVSVAGRRAGLAGNQSGLWFEFVRILDELRPRIAVIENVPGLLSSNHGKDFAVILSGLVELGYRVAWRVLDSQYFGVAQRRRRVFIVGSLGNGSCAEILFEREGLPGNPTESRRTGQDVAASVVSRTGKGGFTDPVNDNVIAATLNSGGGNGGFRTEPGEHLIAHSLTSEGADASEDGSGRGVPIIFQQNQRNEVRDLGVRRLTPTECLRLQGFPDDWLEGSDSAKYRALGNAVTVQVAEWVGRRLKQALGVE